MAKQVTIEMLKQENQMYAEFVEIPVTMQGEEHIIKLFPFFMPEKIRDLVKELGEFYVNAEKEKLIVPDFEQDDIIGYYLVRYFTDLKLSKSKKAKKIYEEFKLVINSKLFKTILNLFPKESVAEVYERINEVIEASSQLQKMYSTLKDQIKELPLENRDILFPENKTDSSEESS